MRFLASSFFCLVFSSVAFANSQSSDDSISVDTVKTYIKVSNTIFDPFSHCNSSDKPEWDSCVLYEDSTEMRELKEKSENFFESSRNDNLKAKIQLSAQHVRKDYNPKCEEVKIDLTNPNFDTTISLNVKYYCSPFHTKGYNSTFRFEIDPPLKIQNKSEKKIINVDNGCAVIKLGECNKNCKLEIQYKALYEENWKELDSYEGFLCSGGTIKISYSDLFKKYYDDEYLRNLGKPLSFRVVRTAINGKRISSNVINYTFIKIAPDFSYKSIHLTSCKDGDYMVVSLENKRDTIFIKDEKRVSWWFNEPSDTVKWEILDNACYKLKIPDTIDIISDITLAFNTFDSVIKGPEYTIDSPRTVILTEKIVLDDRRPAKISGIEQDTSARENFGGFDMNPNDEPVALLRGFSEDNPYKWPLTFSIQEKDDKKSSYKEKLKIDRLPYSFNDLDESKRNSIKENQYSQYQDEIDNNDKKWKLFFSVKFNDFLKKIGAVELDSYLNGQGGSITNELPENYVLIQMGTDYNISTSSVAYINTSRTELSGFCVYLGECNNLLFNNVRNNAKGYQYYTNNDDKSKGCFIEVGATSYDQMKNLNIVRCYDSIDSYAKNVVIATDDLDKKKYVDFLFGKNANMNNSNKGRILIQNVKHIILNSNGDEYCYLGNDGYFNFCTIDRDNLKFISKGTKVSPALIKDDSKVEKLMNYENGFIYYKTTDGKIFEQSINGKKTSKFNYDECVAAYKEYRFQQYLFAIYGLKVPVDKANTDYYLQISDGDGCPMDNPTIIHVKMDEGAKFNCTSKSDPTSGVVCSTGFADFELVSSKNKKPIFLEDGRIIEVRQEFQITTKNGVDTIKYRYDNNSLYYEYKFTVGNELDSNITVVPSINSCNNGEIQITSKVEATYQLLKDSEIKKEQSANKDGKIVFSELEEGEYQIKISIGNCSNTHNISINKESVSLAVEAEDANTIKGQGSITVTISPQSYISNKPYLVNEKGEEQNIIPTENGGIYTFNVSAGTYTAKLNIRNCEISSNTVTVSEPSITATIYSKVDNNGNWEITSDSDKLELDGGEFGDTLKKNSTYGVNYNDVTIVDTINYPSIIKEIKYNNGPCSQKPVQCIVTFNQAVKVNGQAESNTYIITAENRNQNLLIEYAEEVKYGLSTITLVTNIYLPNIIDEKEFPNNIDATINYDNLICFGQEDTIIEVKNITGGTGSYKCRISLDDKYIKETDLDGNSYAYVGNASGEYKVEIIDRSYDCLRYSKTFTISQPPQITFNTAIDSQICADEENATIYVKDITGGVGKYSYYVDSELFIADDECETCNDNLQDIIAAHQNPTISHLGAGNHVVTVMDSNYCFQQKEVEITPYQNPNVSSATSNPVSCNGLSDGVINIKTYNWQTDITRNLCTELNCIKTIEYKGVSSAIVDFSQTIDNLVAGTYELYLVDNNNCRSDSVYHITIQQPEPIKLQAIQTSSKIAEYGANNGGANFRVSGGNEGNSLLMCSDTVFDILTRDNNKIIEAFEAGNYSLFAIDSKGCHSDTVLLQFVQPQSPLSLTTTVKDALCKSSTGSILLDAQGGWGKYKFSIDNQTMLKSISDSFEFDGLYSGLHTVSVIDSMGAIRSAQVYVNQPDSLVVIPSVIPADDNNSYGKAILNISGGVSPYRSFGSFTSDTVKQSTAEFVLQPRAQFYSIETRDSNNCKVVTKVNVNKRNIDVELVSVYNRNDILSVPTLVAKVTGATNSCTYAWEKWNQDILSFENIPNAVSDTYYGQPKETYRVTVSDGLSSNSATASVEAAGVMSFDTIVVWYNSGGGNLSASAPCNVFASALIGNNNNHVDLTGCIQGNKVEANNLLSENYLLVAYAIDTIKPLGLSLGNILNDSIKLDTILITSNVKILNPEPIEIWTEVTPVSEAMAYDGYVSVSIYGGMPQFEYTLCHNADPDDTLVGTVDNNGSFVIDNLPSGDYTITVKGQRNQDVASSSFVIEAPLQNLSLSAEVTDALCYGDSSGMVKLTALGGWGDYQFAYNDNQVSDKSDYGFSLRSSYYGLPYGSHTFYVIDGIGTIYRVDSVVNQPDSLRIVSAKVDSVSCYSYNDGVVKLTIDGGFGQYHSFWHTATQATIFDMTITTDSLFYADNYLFFVKDDNNCRSVDYEVVVPQPDSLQLQIIDTTHTTCELNNGRISVKYVGGSLPYHYNWICNGDSMNVNKSTIENLVGRNEYQIKVMDAHGCQSATTVQRINTSKNPKINCIIVDSVSCYGYNDGVIHVNYNGVSPAYPYAPWLVQWPNGTQSGWLSSNLDSTWSGGYYTGFYNVIVRDTNNCVDSVTIKVPQPDSLMIIKTLHNNAACFGYNDGELKVSAEGYQSFVKFKWSINDTTNHIANLVAGDYSVSATDRKGCQAENTFTITQPEKVILELGDDVIMCPGNAYTINSGDYAGYLWTHNGDSIGDGRSLTVTDSGMYKLLVKDIINCFAIDSVHVSIGEDALVADFLIPSEAYLSDTIMAVEISNLPQLDSVRWYYSQTDFELSGRDTASYLLCFTPNNTGVFEIGLKAYSGGCISEQTRFIEIYPDSLRTDSVVEINNDPLIRSFIVSPNPTSGQITASIELREPIQCNVSVFDMVGTLIKRIELDGDSVYNEPIDLTGYQSGMYVIYLEVKTLNKGVRIILR